MARYLLTFAALVVLSGTRLLASFFDLGSWSIVLAIAIAAVKAILIVCVFMHSTNKGPRIAWRRHGCDHGAPCPRGAASRPTIDLFCVGPLLRENAHNSENGKNGNRSVSETVLSACPGRHEAESWRKHLER